MSQRGLAPQQQPLAGVGELYIHRDDALHGIGSGDLVAAGEGEAGEAHRADQGAAAGDQGHAHALASGSVVGWAAASDAGDEG